MPDDKERFVFSQYQRVYHGFDGFSEAFYRELLEVPTNLKILGKITIPIDRNSPCVSVSNGIRRTAYQPDAYDHSVFLIGRSYIFGTSSDDEHTIASYLQKRCNATSKAEKQYLVHNIGINGHTNDSFHMNRLESLPIKPGDIVIYSHSLRHFELTAEKDLILPTIKRMQAVCRDKGVHFSVFIFPEVCQIKKPSRYEQAILYYDDRTISDRDWVKTQKEKYSDWNSAITNKLLSHDITAFDLVPVFQRPHDMGEVFIDNFHMAYRGNARIADMMYDWFVKNLLSKEDAVDNLDRKILESYVRSASKCLTITKESVSWLMNIPRYTLAPGKVIGAIVMNCNPFTNGHRHILTQVCKLADKLYVFIVQEDKSFFSFQDRLHMLQDGTAEFGEKICIVPSGTMIISSSSFPEYFSKENITYVPDAFLDIMLFGTYVASNLSINVRFFGEEPNCSVTREYHSQIKEVLPIYGIQCVEIPRLKNNNTPISASLVRSMIQRGELAGLGHLVPPSTLEYLVKTYYKSRE